MGCATSAPAVLEHESKLVSSTPGVEVISLCGTTEGIQNQVETDNRAQQHGSTSPGINCTVETADIVAELPTELPLHFSFHQSLEGTRSRRLSPTIAGILTADGLVIQSPNGSQNGGCQRFMSQELPSSMDRPSQTQTCRISQELASVINDRGLLKSSFTQRMANAPINATEHLSNSLRLVRRISQASVGSDTSPHTSAHQGGALIHDVNELEGQPIRLLKQIGRGGFGCVYLADWCGRRVAVKVVTGWIDDDDVEQGALDRKRQQMTQLEALLMSAMEHPNVVTTHKVLAGVNSSIPSADIFDGNVVVEDVGGAPGAYHWYIIMEYCEHNSLWAALVKGVFHKVVVNAPQPAAAATAAAQAQHGMGSAPAAVGAVTAAEPIPFGAPRVPARTPGPSLASSFTGPVSMTATAAMIAAAGGGSLDAAGSSLTRTVSGSTPPCSSSSASAVMGAVAAAAAASAAGAAGLWQAPPSPRTASSGTSGHGPTAPAPATMAAAAGLLPHPRGVGASGAWGYGWGGAGAGTGLLSPGTSGLRPRALGGAVLLVAWDAWSCLQTLREVVSALEYLHANGIIHCDLKAANILLAASTADRRGFTAKVTDFGFSRVITRSSSIGTYTYGTVTHQPPELLERGLLTPGSDTFALGVSMWEALTARKVFSKLNDSEVLCAIVRDGLRPTFPPDAPPRYRALAERCWAARPADRPKLSEVAAELAAIQDELCPYGPLSPPVILNAAGVRIPTSRRMSLPTPPTPLMQQQQQAMLVIAQQQQLQQQLAASGQRVPVPVPIPARQPSEQQPAARQRPMVVGTVAAAALLAASPPRASGGTTARRSSMDARLLALALQQRDSTSSGSSGGAAPHAKSVRPTTSHQVPAQEVEGAHRQHRLQQHQGEEATAAGGPLAAAGTAAPPAAGTTSLAPGPAVQHGPDSSHMASSSGVPAEAAGTEGCSPAHSAEEAVAVADAMSAAAAALSAHAHAQRVGGESAPGTIATTAWGGLSSWEAVHMALSDPQLLHSWGASSLGGMASRQGAAAGCNRGDAEPPSCTSLVTPQLAALVRELQAGGRDLPPALLHALASVQGGGADSGAPAILLQALASHQPDGTPSTGAHGTGARQLADA